MFDVRNPDQRRWLVDRLAETAVTAGNAIMAVYRQDIEVVIKADASPVTVADAAAEAIILRALHDLAPDIPVIAEEEVAAGRVPDVHGTFFLVDPLDGTKEFIQRRDDFTVNIALIDDHAPVIGIVHAPAHRALYVGDVVACYAWTAQVGEDGTIVQRRPMRVREAPERGLSAVASKSHNTPETDAYLQQFTVADVVSCGSSLKICMVADGRADLYPRLSPTCEWDIGAGDAVLRAAGGGLFAPEGEPMLYGKPGFFNAGFVAAGTLIPPPIAGFLRALN